MSWALGLWALELALLVPLDHNWPATDELRLTLPGGTPVAGAQVRVWEAERYAGRRRAPDALVGQTETDAGGRWVEPVYVSDGAEYVLEYTAAGRMQPVTARMTVMLTVTPIYTPTPLMTHTIMPTVITTTTITPVDVLPRVAHMKEEDGTHGAGLYSCAIWSDEMDDWGTYWEGLLRWPDSSLAGVAASDCVIAATGWFYVGNPLVDYLYVYAQAPLLKDWDWETVDCAYYAPGQAWEEACAMGANDRYGPWPGAGIYMHTYAERDWHAMNMTACVRAWVGADRYLENYGVIISHNRAIDETECHKLWDPGEDPAEMAPWLEIVATPATPTTIPQWCGTETPCSPTSTHTRALTSTRTPTMTGNTPTMTKTATRWPTRTQTRTMTPPPTPTNTHTPGGPPSATPTVTPTGVRGGMPAGDYDFVYWTRNGRLVYHPNVGGVGPMWEFHPGDQAWYPLRPTRLGWPTIPRTGTQNAVLMGDLYWYDRQTYRHDARLEQWVERYGETSWDGNVCTVADPDDDTRLYRVGGMGRWAVGDFQWYSAQSNSWETLAPLPTPRADTQAVIHDGRVYVMGGFDAQYLRDMRIYDIKTQQWEQGASALVPLRYHRAAEVNGTIYVFGSSTDVSNYQTKAYKYVISYGHWLPIADQPSPRIRGGIGVIGGHIYLYGGVGGGNVLNSMVIYRPETDDYVEVE